MSGGKHWHNSDHLHRSIRFVPPNSLLRLAGLNWPVPNFSTLCRRQKTLAVQIPYRRADGPLNLLVDSTGIKFLGDGGVMPESW